jgi:small subunit ribosomal protein S11
MSEETEKKQEPQAVDASAPEIPVKKSKPSKEESAGAEQTTEVTAEAATEAEKRPAQPSAKDLLAEEIGEVKIRKAKGSKNVHSGMCHILATFNNTKVTFTDANGNVLSWSSSGKCNFRGSRKSTAYAAQVVTQDAGRVAMSHGLKEVAVKVRGPGMGRDSAIRALQSLGLIVLSIVDVTPVPHNGCRPPKRRRV